mgnify:CR=1 FL=1
MVLASLMFVTYLICYYRESGFPSFVHKALKELSASIKTDLLQSLANNIGWSQTHCTDIANAQLLPYVVLGAKSGSMTVKVSFKKSDQKCYRKK